MNNEDSIVAKLRTGDHSAVGTIYKDYYKRLSYLITQNSGEEEDARDVFQEALIIFIEKVNRPDFELTATIFTFLYSTCRNIWFTELRRRKKEFEFQETERIEGIEPVQEVAAGEAEEEVSVDTVIDRVFSQLGELCQKLLTYFYLYGWSMKQIAVEMEYASEQTARQQKHRCLIKARSIYSQMIS